MLNVTPAAADPLRMPLDASPVDDESVGSRTGCADGVTFLEPPRARVIEVAAP
jgi:hypothetical protein